MPTSQPNQLSQPCPGHTHFCSQWWEQRSWPWGQHNPRRFPRATNQAPRSLWLKGKPRWLPESVHVSSESWEKFSLAGEHHEELKPGEQKGQESGRVSQQ